MGRSRHSDMHAHHLEALGASFDHVLHPFHNSPQSRGNSGKSIKEVDRVYISSAKRVSGGNQGATGVVAAPSSGGNQGAAATTYTIPCHHVRVGDVVILQQRPCQLIRITTSATTGQHRYLGVDLFTRELHEEPCVVTHPSPSVILHSMMGPVYKEYRVIDISETGKLIAMTETGDLKPGLRVIDQGGLSGKIKSAYGNGSGLVRVLVVADGDNELAVDYKTVHNSFKL